MAHITTNQQPNEEAMKKYSRLQEIRQKNWDDCTDGEKAEKLKMAIESESYLRQTITHMQEQIRKLEKHSHATNGDVVVPFSNNYPSGSGILSGNMQQKGILD